MPKSTLSRIQRNGLAAAYRWKSLHVLQRQIFMLRVQKPLSDVSLCFTTCVILRDDNTSVDRPTIGHPPPVPQPRQNKWPASCRHS